MKIRMLILSVLLVSAFLLGRLNEVVIAPVAEACFDCESCAQNVTDDETDKLQVCLLTCGTTSNPSLCGEKCWGAYRNGRCAQMKGLCPSCQTEIAVACGPEN